MTEKFADRFPPSVTAAKLYEKTSAKGNSYLIGRLGGMRVAVIKTQETSEDGAPIWELKFSQAPASDRSKASSRTEVLASDSSTPTRSFASSAADDQIPF